MYKQIFRAVCAQKGLEYVEGEIDGFITRLRHEGRALAACQPRDLLEQLVDHAVYRGEKPALTAEARKRPGLA